MSIIAPIVEAWYDIVMHNFNSNELINSYTQASNRLFLFDYDGVLSPIVDRPELAKPTPELHGLLNSLASNPKNKFVIVTGRSHVEIDNWLGDLPVDISAEHGSYRKLAGEQWRRLTDPSENWKNELLPTLESAVSELPGSFVEHKSTALVFHYRAVDAEIADATLFEIMTKLSERAKDLPVVIQPGKKIIDIHLSTANKGTAIQHWLSQPPAHDFIMIAGDDTTDEDMFKVAPGSAWTYHIGSDKTAAKYSIPSSSDVIELLSEVNDS